MSDKRNSMSEQFAEEVLNAIEESKLRFNALLAQTNIIQQKIAELNQHYSNQLAELTDRLNNLERGGDRTIPPPLSNLGGSTTVLPEE